MITKKKTIKSILGCTTACSALLMTGVGALALNQSNNTAYAAKVDSIPVSITNSNFNSNTSSSYPYSPSSYAAYNHGVKVESGDNNEANVKAGVINLSNEKYETRFSLAKRSSLDDYVLMIDSTDEDDTGSMHVVNYGYQTTSNFTLEANSKYMFTVDVFTATNANIANLYLFDNNGDVHSSINNINSYNNWTTYSFFVATNNIEGLELKLGMYLEGAGTVLFDNIAGYKLSDNEYSNSINNSSGGTFTETNHINNIENRFYVNNLGYLQDAESSATSNFTNVEFELNNQTVLARASDSDGQNDYSVLVKNTEKSYSQYETEDILSFEQNKIYKVSVSVKTKNLNGTATLQMIRTDIDEDDEDYDAENHNKTISITSNTVSSNDSVTNDYSTYSFLINSHPSKTLTYKLKFGLGTSENLTSGEMYLSEIEVSKIDYETYNSATTGSGTEKINFVDAYADNSIMLNNGDFNAFKIADYTEPMPAAPIDWTVSTGKNTQYHGVVNTKTFIKDLGYLGLSNLRNPSSDNNNVLMMYNETADKLSYTSKSKKLTAKTYHKFEIDVQTQNAPLTLSLVSTKDDSEITLTSKTVNTSNTWEKVTLYVFSGYQDIDVSLKLTLNTTSYGYAYADNATFDYLLTSTQLEGEFKSASESTFVHVADLSNITISTNEKFAKPELFTAPSVSGVQSGTITLNSNYLDEVIDYVETEPGFDSNLDIFNSIASNETNKNVLGIWTTEDVAYTMTSNVGFKITSGTDKYYKITVDVFTQNIGSNNSEANEDTLGAGIKLTGFDNPFTSLKSNNAWTTYTFYIQGESDTTTYLELSLGSEEAKTKGSVFFGNITFADDVTKAEFELAKESDVVNILKAEVKDTEDDSDNESSKKDNKISKVDLIYLIPSLLTALAILIAIVGFAVRKIKWKKPTKKSKTAYDRNKTVSVQYYSRKATTLREEKVRELTADLNKINEERKQYEDVYKQDLTRLREMKIKRANPADIAKLEKDLKKNQKMSSSLGMTANRISDELEYVKTSAYLNSLIKKLMREPSTKSDDEQNQ